MKTILIDIFSEIHVQQHFTVESLMPDFINPSTTKALEMFEIASVSQCT